MSDAGPERESVDLDGDWEFVTDPTGRGINDEWYEPDVEWPDRTRTVEVPMAWEELETYREYTGTAWYRRTVEFTADALAGRDAILRFDAVDYETTVWVDGQEVGYNRGGYLPFELDATDALSPGATTVVVRVTDPADLAEIPHGKQGDPWYTRVSGIWQSVAFRLRPRTRVRNAEVIPDLSTDTAVVECEVRPGPRERDALSCTVQARRDGTVVATSHVEVSEETEAILDFDDPAYWWPDDPALYDLRIVVTDGEERLDVYTDYFGMRSFETEDGRFLLNGEPITLRGVLEQGYYPETHYRPPTPETFTEEIATAKRLGFNLIRKHVKPAHPDFLERADRKGILLWAELANPIRYTAASRSAMRDQLKRLVERDFNHPSVVIWGLFNEEWGIGHHDTEETLWTDERKQQMLADMVRWVRERDVTRVVCDNSGWAHVSTDVNDFHRYFVSPDQATAWERDLEHICQYPGDNFATTEFDSTDAPIVISELGTWGLSDVSTLREQYDGDPPWFFHEFLTEQLKRPENVGERFAATDLPDAFGDLETLAEAWQRREFVSIKHLVEQIRRREAIAGYVLTELSDIEWEFNGLLDYLRTDKNFVDEFAAVNSAVSVVADVASHVGWDESTVRLRISVVNDTRDTLSGTVSWSLSGTDGTMRVTAPPNQVTELDPVSVALSADGDVNRHQLRVRFEHEESVVETREPVTVVDPTAWSSPDATVFAEGAFASALAREGLSVTHDIEAASVAFVDRISEGVAQFAADGGDVVQVPVDGGEMIRSGPFTFQDVPEPETWIGTASFLYQQSSLCADICARSRLGWEFEGLYPSAVATDLDPTGDEIHAGYVEGWVANWGSPLVTREYGSGSITALTFDVRDAYGTHPIATLLVNRIVQTVSDDGTTTTG